MTLRDIVNAATPGPWEKPESSNHDVVLQQRPHVRYHREAWFHEPDGWQAKADSEFIATFDPVLVAALLDVIDTLGWVHQALPSLAPGDLRSYESSLVRVSDLRRVAAALDRLDELEAT